MNFSTGWWEEWVHPYFIFFITNRFNRFTLDFRLSRRVFSIILFTKKVILRGWLTVFFPFVSFLIKSKTYFLSNFSKSFLSLVSWFIVCCNYFNGLKSSLNACIHFNKLYYHLNMLFFVPICSSSKVLSKSILSKPVILFVSI